ncbi:MAG: C45 family autoproteolytic acyltransferase/hydrolase [Alphaproteobacteria bacterium]
MTALPILDLGDDPYERGLVHGRTLAAEVRGNLHTYLARFAAGGLDADVVRAEGDVWAEVIAAQNAEYAEEMRGIADGAGMSLAELAVLNARYEITFGLFGREAKAADALKATEGTDGCSSFGALAEATADGHTILGQNWDWLAGIHGRCVVLRITRRARPSLVCFTEAGIVGGKMGINANGIGLVENGLVSDHDGRHPREKPFHVRCREVLDAETYDHALAPIVATRRVCSANFVIGQAGGEIVDIETSPDAVSYLFPRDGLVTHSNHFMDPRHGPSQMERIGPSTIFRASRLDRLLRRHVGRLDRVVIAGALADHFGYPNAICRHPDERQPEAKRTMSNASLILDLDDRVMWVANGPPCCNAYVAYPLEPTAATETAWAAQ